MSSHCVMNGYVIQMFWSNCKCSYVHFKVFTLKCLHVFFFKDPCKFVFWRIAILRNLRCCNV